MRSAAPRLPAERGGRGYDQRMDEREGRRYRSLPEPVRLDETIASVDTRPVLDADSMRNVDQDNALRDGG